MNIKSLQNGSSTRKMVFSAIMAAIAIILNQVEIPYPAAAHLRIELSESIVLFVVMVLGLRYGLMLSVVKTVVFTMMGSNGSDSIGVVMLLVSSCFLATTFHLLITRINLIPSLIISSIIFAVTMTLLNYFIVLPLYFVKSFSELNNDGYLFGTVALYLPFNLIKMTLISGVIVLINKLLLKNSMM